MRFLSGIGCSYQQCYYFSEPLPPAEVSAVLREKHIRRESRRESAFYKALFRAGTRSDRPETTAAASAADRGGWQEQPPEQR